MHKSSQTESKNKLFLFRDFPARFARKHYKSIPFDKMFRTGFCGT